MLTNHNNDAVVCLIILLSLQRHSQGFVGVRVRSDEVSGEAGGGVPFVDIRLTHKHSYVYRCSDILMRKANIALRIKTKHKRCGVTVKMS